MIELLDWYDKNKRNLPWRNTNKAYNIWLSEIILQQTRVEQGENYYLKFIETYPDVNSLAKASLDEVFLLWQGLGYYSRARNMHKTAGIIVDRYKSEIPSDYKTLLTLPGIGPYTAAAISSIAFNNPVAAVDGNVYRVLSRLFAEHTPIDSGDGKKIFARIANELLDVKFPGRHNQAMMELGARICIPRQPKCPVCPIEYKCFARKGKLQHTLPVKKNKNKIQIRHFYFFIIESDGEILIEKRTDEDIWKGLYQFPLIEYEKKLSVEEILRLAGTKYQLDKQTSRIIFISQTIPHYLSHQKISAIFVHLISKRSRINGSFLSVPKDNLRDYAFPRLITRYLDNMQV